ncbi:hypothetical protein Q31b_47080 [Novipirellula aureliae]|uniref:Right handed beta helix domain-containing protein n=1 Tax=Novipirellula aureliae TaxID=2527966 RepID=A0A5C6DT42_9BACT|nr:right-handed parallel beta-helix repeat-containing protein [Novipirellula aureliae]TWU37919.1 hypothetical protein Q31b_47080 [Novipirellula aureliae]
MRNFRRESFEMGMKFEGFNWRSLSVAVVLFFSVLLQSAWAATTMLYVSPDGNDQWSGQYADPKAGDGPLATLDAARLKVRQMKAARPEDSFEVQVRGGEYELRETVVFGPEDSGSRGASVVYKAYAGETPVFTGGIPISNWKKCTKNPVGVAQEAKGKLWVAEIPDAKKLNWSIKSLYDGDRLLQRATSGELMRARHARDNDYNMQGKKIWRELGYEGEPVAPFDRDIYFKGNDMRAWENVADIEIVLRDRRWIYNLLPLKKVDAQKKVAWTAVDPTYQPLSPSRYWVENAIDYLDAPGEWVFNSEEGRLYIWPKNDINKMNVIAPYLQEFIRVEGEEDGHLATFIGFEGLTFKHGLRDTWVEGDKGLQHDWEMYDKGNAVLRFLHAEDCMVNQCQFIASSGTGIRLDLHCQRITVSSNLLRNLGGNGILLSGYGPGTKDVNKNNVVTNNYIHNIGELYWHSAGIFITQSGHNQVTHNTICDVPYNGLVISGCRPHEFYIVKRIPFRRAWMSTIRVEECEPYTLKGLKAEWQTPIEHFLPLLHARENLISMNDISRTLQKLGDGNAIYLSAMGENNRLERNYLHDNYHTAGTIRLDDNPSYTIIKENVLTEADRGIGIKGPCEMVNNFIFTDMFMRGDVTTSSKVKKGTKSERNIYFPPADSKEKRGYFLYGDGKKDVPYHSKLPLMENSIYFSLSKAKPFVPATGLGTDLVSGNNVNPGKDAVKLLYADPMFDEDAMKQKIFRFKKGSPAIALGIQPIDLSTVGSTLAE